MRVRGTLVLAVMVKEHLWGLVVAHDPLPRSVAYQTRMACEFLAQARVHARTRLECNDTPRVPARTRGLISDGVRGPRAGAVDAAVVADRHGGAPALCACRYPCLLLFRAAAIYGCSSTRLLSSCLLLRVPAAM